MWAGYERMARTSMYWCIGNDCYIVARIKDNLPKGHKDRYKEYIVDLKGGDAMCDCIGCQRYKKKCRHIKDVLEQLKSGGGTIHYLKEGELDKLFNLVERKKMLD